MTAERRLIFALSDIAAVTLHCKNCGVRLHVSPEKLKSTHWRRCGSCASDWIHDETIQDDIHTKPMARFLTALGQTARNQDQLGVDVAFEFAEPKA
jgi:hypothetical protein